MNPGVILGRLTPYLAREYKIRDEQSTGDIISAITKAHIEYRPEYKKIAAFFKGSTPRETGKKIFDFLKKNVRYNIEPADKQTVRSPSAILAEGSTGGDCKHYASWAGGVLDQLGIPFAYRFASYRMFDKTPQHVFVVINPGTSNEIWLDPVLNTYDYKKPYTYAKDKKMALYQVSGIGATAAQKAALKQAKAAKKAAQGSQAKKAAKTEVKAARKAAGRTAGQVLKKGAKVVLKVAASPVRNAFLLLVKINFANLGNKLASAYAKAPSKVQIFWEQAGGKIEALKKAWEAGSKKKRIFGIGVVPAAGSAPAIAAPLLVKVASLLKSIGIDPAELVQIGKDAINVKAQELAKKVLQPKAATEAAEIQVADEAVPDQPETTTTAAPTMRKMSTTLPLILGGAAIIYFVTRKK